MHFFLTANCPSTVNGPSFHYWFQLSLQICTKFPMTYLDLFLHSLFWSFNLCVCSCVSSPQLYGTFRELTEQASSALLFEHFLAGFWHFIFRMHSRGSSVCENPGGFHRKQQHTHFTLGKTGICKIVTCPIQEHSASLHSLGIYVLP